VAADRAGENPGAGRGARAVALRPAFPLLARKVRPGDPDNVEAEAARRYWPLLFGPQFRRDTDGGGLNGLLNYAMPSSARNGARRDGGRPSSEPWPHAFRTGAMPWCSLTT